MVATDAVILKIALKLLIILLLKKPGFVPPSFVCYSLHGEEAVDFNQTLVYQSLWCYQQMYSVHRLKEGRFGATVIT